MAAMSFLKPSEETTVPSWPSLETITGAVGLLCVVTAKTLPDPGRVIRIRTRDVTNTSHATGRGDDVAGALAQCQVPLPEVFAASAPVPRAVLLLPVLTPSALLPIAVFKMPSAPFPLLCEPLLLVIRLSAPTAVFKLHP